jgi:hypothetical protein
LVFFLFSLFFLLLVSGFFCAGFGFFIKAGLDGILQEKDGQRTYRHHHFPRRITIYYSVSQFCFIFCFTHFWAVSIQWRATNGRLLLDSTACRISSTGVDSKKISEKDNICYKNHALPCLRISTTVLHNVFFVLFVGCLPHSPPSAARKKPGPAFGLSPTTFGNGNGGKYQNTLACYKIWGILMQNMGEAAAAATHQGVMEGREKSHGQGGASVGPAGMERDQMDDFIDTLRLLGIVYC